MALVPYDALVAGSAARAMPERCFDVAGRRVTILQEFKPDGRGGSSTEFGFGANVYNSSLVLSCYLAEHRAAALRGARVVELGCGTGLVSISCALLGAAEVLATDGDTKLLELTQRNIELNQVAGVARACPLVWGDEQAHQACGGPADVVLAADVAAFVYEAAFGQLVDSLRAMSKPDSLVLLAYERRHGAEREFFELLERHFVVSQVPRQALHKDFQSEQQLFPIVILQLVPKS